MWMLPYMKNWKLHNQPNLYVPYDLRIMGCNIYSMVWNTLMPYVFLILDFFPGPMALSKDLRLLHIW